MRCWRFPPVIPPLDTTWATDARLVQQDAYLPCLLRCTAPARSAARPDHTARPDCLAATPTRVCSLRASQPAVPRCPGAGCDDVPSQALISGCSFCFSSAITAGVQRALSPLQLPQYRTPHSGDAPHIGHRTVPFCECPTTNPLANTHGSPLQAEAYPRGPTLLHVALQVCCHVSFKSSQVLTCKQ